MKLYLTFTFIILTLQALFGDALTTTPQPSSLKKFMPKRFEAQLKEAKSREIDWVMIGDSITHNWESEKGYAETFAPYKMLNLGFAGDGTQQVLWRLQNGAVDGLTPKLVTLMIGTNNAHARGNSVASEPSEIFEGIQAIVKELTTRLPKSEIIVCSIFPRAAGEENDRVKAVNALLPALAKQKKVQHVDLNRHFLNKQGEINRTNYKGDGLHLSSGGYSTWRRVLQPILAEAGLAPQNAPKGKKAPSAKKKSAPDKQDAAVARPAATPNPEIDPINTVWFQQPADAFTQSLVIGSGRIGAMVYGNPEKEQIVLNDKSLWSGSKVEHDISGGHKNLPEIRKLLAAEKFTEANKLMKTSFKVNHGPKYGTGISPFGRFQTLGKLHLEFAGNESPVTDYHRELDLSAGLGKVTYKRGEQSYTREHFVSAPDQVFVTRLSGPVKFTASMDRPERSETQAVGDHELLITGHLDDGFGKDGMQYVGRLRVIAPDGAVKAVGNTLQIDSAEDVTLLVAVATDYQGLAGRGTADPLTATQADLNNAAEKSFDELRVAQQADHEQYYERISLELPVTESSSYPTDARLARYAEGKADPALAALFYNMGRYLIISSSRPGELPANLQGTWAEEVHTMWNGDYHFNINTQMNYWLTMPCNLVEMNEPMINFIDSLVEPGTKTAHAYYGTRGWIAHRLTNVWGYTSPAGMDIGGAAWLCEHLWEQYAFTMDQDFLQKVYPIMKSSCEFYLDNLYEEPENGWLVTGPSASPETGFLLPGGGQTGICAGPTIDLQQLRELFGNTIKATEILGVDEELKAELAEARPKIAPNQIDPEGRLQEWLKPYETREPGHRHVSPLYGLFPYYEITPEGTPEMAKAAQALLEQRGLAQSTGWSNAWKINLWARLGNAEQSAAFVRHMIVDNTFDNLLSKFRPAREGGKKNLFQIEANLGYTSGVTEMLLQSHPTGGELEATPVIRILPALPAHWREGSIKGLRARGGFLVDLSWQDGALTDCTIKSLTGTNCLVRYADKTQEVALQVGEEQKVLPGQ